MSKIAMIYSTTDGHTKVIVEFLCRAIDASNLVQISSVSSATNMRLDYFDKVVIGASIRYGNYKSELFKYIESQRDILETKDTYFFSVNVVARKHDKSTPATNPYMIKFLEKTTWKPNYTAVFAGKVNYPSYNIFNKSVIRLIMYATGGPTDTSRSFEFTDWTHVKHFGKKISENESR